MAWLISKALMENLESSRSLPEQEAESSAENCLDGEPSAQLKSTPTAQAYLYSDKTMAFSRLSRYGMTLEHLTESRGEELLTLFLEGFHAKTLAQPDAEMESTVREADSGEKWCGSLAKYDRASRLWKTAQCSLLEGLDVFSATWPKWGMMQDGECWDVAMPAGCTNEVESGYLAIPTIGKNETKGSSQRRYRNSRFFRGAKMSEGLRISEKDPIYTHPRFAELMMGWPLNWSRLQPLETGKFQFAQQWLLKFCLMD